MYIFASKEEVKAIRSRVEGAVNDALAEIRKKLNVKIQLQLVGSGSTGMVTKHEEGGFDLDYNIIFSKFPKGAEINPGKLKDLVRLHLDNHLNVMAKHGQDSKSVLTYILTGDKDAAKDSIDFAILRRNPDGAYERLIHDKSRDGHSTKDRYIWNISKEFCDVSRELKVIKTAGKLPALCEKYLAEKNSEEDLPVQSRRMSYEIYIHAVKEICDKIERST